MDVSTNLNSQQNKEVSVLLSNTEQDERYFASICDTEVLETMNEGSSGPVLGAFSPGDQQSVQTFACPPSRDLSIDFSGQYPLSVY